MKQLTFGSRFRAKSKRCSVMPNSCELRDIYFPEDIFDNFLFLVRQIMTRLVYECQRYICKYNIDYVSFMNWIHVN